MKFKFVAVVIAAAMLPCCAQIVVVHVPVPRPEKISTDAKSGGDTMNTGAANKTEMEGLFYALPKTVVRVGVKVKHSVATPAPYMKFAAIFAPEGQPVCEEGTCKKEGKDGYDLEQGASLATFGEPDPQQVYMVKFLDPWTWGFDQAVSMTWTESGLLSTASASVTNRTADIAFAGIKMLTGLGTKAAYGLALAPVKVELLVCPKPSKNDRWITPILRDEQSGTAVTNYCAMKVEDRDKFDAADSDLLQQAVDAYKGVAEFIDARIELLTGRSHSMAPAELVGRLETLIGQRLTALYLGSKTTDTWDGSLNIDTLDNEKAVSNPIPILYIDPKIGVCIGKDATIATDSKPFPEQFNILEEDKCKTSESASPLHMVISFYPERDKQLFQAVKQNIAKPSPTDDRSFRYRIPAQVKAELKYHNKPYGVGVFAVAQLGTVVSLPANHFSKTLSYDLTFIEATGGLKSFKLGTTGMLDIATIETLNQAGGTIIDARNAARKAEETSKDEVTTLTRQNTLLKMKDENCDILKKYGSICTDLP
jgi:hypothetical protein